MHSPEKLSRQDITPRYREHTCNLAGQGSSGLGCSPETVESTVFISQDRLTQYTSIDQVPKGQKVYKVSKGTIIITSLYDHNGRPARVRERKKEKPGPSLFDILGGIIPGFGVNTLTQNTKNTTTEGVGASQLSERYVESDLESYFLSIEQSLDLSNCACQSFACFKNHFIKALEKSIRNLPEEEKRNLLMQSSIYLKRSERSWSEKTSSMSMQGTIPLGAKDAMSGRMEISENTVDFDTTDLTDVEIAIIANESNRRARQKCAQLLRQHRSSLSGLSFGNKQFLQERGLIL